VDAAWFAQASGTEPRSADHDSADQLSGGV